MLFIVTTKRYLTRARLNESNAFGVTLSLPPLHVRDKHTHSTHTLYGQRSGDVALPVRLKTNVYITLCSSVHSVTFGVSREQSHDPIVNKTIFKILFRLRQFPFFKYRGAVGSCWLLRVFPSGTGAQSLRSSRHNRLVWYRFPLWGRDEILYHHVGRRSGTPLHYDPYSLITRGVAVPSEGCYNLPLPVTRCWSILPRSILHTFASPAYWQNNLFSPIARETPPVESYINKRVLRSFGFGNNVVKRKKGDRRVSFVSLPLSLPTVYARFVIRYNAVPALETVYYYQ